MFGAIILFLSLSFHLLHAGSFQGAVPSSSNSSQQSHQDQQQELSSSSTSKPVLSVLLISTWLSGHQIHLLGVGGELVKRGHKVSFLSTEVQGSNIIPHVPEKLGMKFLSAGPDPKTKEEYEKFTFSLMGQSVLQQRWAIVEIMQEHLYKLRVAIDGFNCSDWDIILADYLYSMNLVRHLTLNCEVKIVLSASSILDYISVAPPWPYPSVYFGGSSDDISLYHKFASTFYQLLLPNSIGTLLTKLYLVGNDSELWNSVYKDPYFFYPPDVLYPMLYYSAVGMEYAHPHYPNIHMVGPILSVVTASLQENLRLWLDSKKEGGVVYVSMGTTAVLTKGMATSLVKGVESAGYNMVWSLRKTNQDIIEGLDLDEDRFFVSSWVPQVAVLQHAAVGVAILHCGSGGLHEALSSSVPVICIPFMSDQFSWASKIQVQGVGLAMSAEEVTTDRVLISIQRVAGKEYRERVRKLSKVLKQAGGARKAADLIEFYADVGYDHLLTAYVKYRWGWVQYYSLDMYCLVITTLLCGACICSKLCRKRTH